MISISKYNIYKKDDIAVILSSDNFRCPVCGCREYHVHGTCLRKVRTFNGVQQFRLRVLACNHCGRTHRELPADIVPYKRFSADCIASIALANRPSAVQNSVRNNFMDCEYTTWLRIKVWLDWLIQQFKNIEKSYSPTFNNCLPSQFTVLLKELVSAVVNSNQWNLTEQHRSA